ncbi:MAG: SpoIID/LytB domain-containing protein [Armatimonadota bacterium]|nr:SpoIID/LytB domain-containing protein [Armatimonadota bacterium]MDR7550508.1 SpoIID/LytB domain-containing protein [Armatimonadota bacterium]
MAAAWVALCAFIGVGLLAAGPVVRAQPPASAGVRVGLLLGQEAVTIGADGPFEVVESGRRETREGGRLVARPGAEGIDLDGTAYGAIIRLVPHVGFLQVNGRPYRGIVELRRTPAGRLTVINELDLEEYLYGVVRMEMDPRWPPEALRAQAVAARSLAVGSSRRFAAEGYDVRATTDSQVYGGVAAEDPRTTAAVDATRGLVIFSEGRPAFAAYHTDSGGATESSEFVWGSVMPHLRGVADPHSRDAPTAQWTLRLEFATIEAALQRAGRPLVGLQRVEVVSTSPSGRVMTLRLTAQSGSAEIRGVDFRTAVGVGVVRSTLFAVRPLPGEAAVELVGRGSGHGVGMSQWGARGQALAGRDYTEILRYYYTGVSIGPRP